MAPGDTGQEDDSRPQSNTPNVSQPGRNAPLVIVSERGRHSDEARRIVRAQAARASAAQSRVTRARNREEREGASRENPLSSTSNGPAISGSNPAGHLPPGQPATPQPTAAQGADTQGTTGPTPSTQPAAPEVAVADAANDAAGLLAKHPLIKWLVGLLDLSPTGLLQNVQDLVVVGPAAVGAVTSTVTSGLGSVLGGVAGLAGFGGSGGRPQLPQAVPRGFTVLQQRIQISDNLVILVSRTSCFDFGSPGVEERLHQLLYDLILSHAKALLTPIFIPGHPIQGHLRIACTCLTIFQGQRANGSVFAHDQKYVNGLEAAWSEALLLDQNALAEPKSAEASLWAVFIISVTTGATVATANYFTQLLCGLFNDLQLRSWLQVRKILLDFIYPVSFLDEPCQRYFDSLQQLQVG